MRSFQIALMVLLAFPLFTNLQAQDDPIDLKSLVEMNDNDEMIQYQEVIQVVASPKQQYDLALKWIKDEFVNPLNVIKERDPNKHLIEGKESFRLYIIHPKTKNRTHKGAISYKFKLEFKENKYRYTFSEFKLLQTSNFPLERWLDEEGNYYSEKNALFLEQLHDYITNKVLSLENAINPKTEKDDDW